MQNSEFVTDDKICTGIPRKNSHNTESRCSRCIK